MTKAPWGHSGLTKASCLSFQNSPHILRSGQGKGFKKSRKRTCGDEKTAQLTELRQGRSLTFSPSLYLLISPHKNGHRNRGNFVLKEYNSKHYILKITYMKIFVISIIYTIHYILTFNIPISRWYSLASYELQYHQSFLSSLKLLLLVSLLLHVLLST